MFLRITQPDGTPRQVNLEHIRDLGPSKFVLDTETNDVTPVEPLDPGETTIELLDGETLINGTEIRLTDSNYLYAMEPYEETIKSLRGLVPGCAINA